MALVACQAPPSDPASDSGAGVAAAFDGSGGRWVDLSYAYSDETIYWPTDTLGFELQELAYGDTDGGYFYSAYRFDTAEHGGTHLDAPIHFSREGQAADEIPIERLIGPAVVLDVSDRATPDYLVNVADLEAFEREHGPIPGDAILLIRTGWGDRWPNRGEYLGTQAVGPEAVPDLHFPGLHADAARWLVEDRSVAAVGIDTPSIDYGQSTDFASHIVLYGANIPGSRVGAGGRSGSSRSSPAELRSRGLASTFGETS
jgi:kynurenine formamidase